MISGIVVIVLMLGFACVTAWAWSSSKRAIFEEAAMLPLIDDSNQELRS